ncbi:bifunctional folylpolyglutamate synthase/dihydrofolate synthase [Miniphocaeibacter massiliensis]|uniref:bifunctional folylpolyglutamate synthase/dihydrofolate synthase n=1 Tax=Miniphocaeibacter massiliensis TaxID=2041841 RepID=UPI000C0820BB|nr:cyanophycin synthetase [Miniphocaeibacter massiliensis]
MDFEEALYYIENSKYGHSKDLGILKKVLALFDIKGTDFKIIQIAGTNGKGTVGTFLSCFIGSTNKTVGHFISPHIEDYRERFKVNNKLVSKDEFVDIVNYIKSKLDEETKSKLNYFEISLVIALIIFKRNNLEYIILETGIGGRNDITNIFSANELAIITTIDYDHVNTLGNNLEEITKHKAGIIKNNSKVVSFKHSFNIDKIIREEAEFLNSSLYFLEQSDIHVLSVSLNGSEFEYLNHRFKTLMIGEHQIFNILLAFKAFLLLNLDYRIEKISKIISRTRFEGRMEKINSYPKIYIDGAHNSEGLEVLNSNVKKIGIKNYILVLGSMNDKNIFENLQKLIDNSKEIIFTRIDYERAIDPLEMSKLLNLKNKKYKIISNIEDVKKYILKELDKDDTVLITGSLYLVGEFKLMFK